MSSNFNEAIQTVVSTLSVSDLQVLEALLFAPNQAASASQLKTLLGLNAVVQVNAAMGRIGRKLHAALGAHPDGLGSGEYEWWHMIATGQATKDRGFVWQLREEVVAGLLSGGYSASVNPLPNEVTEAETFTEGAVRQILVNAYERNPKAHDRCIEVHGAKCFVCGFDFGAVYGALAAGFIHVHHLKALSTVSEEYEVDPVVDLRPVCPNCHAVIHMTNPARSIEEVKTLLSGRGTSQPP